MSGKLFITTVSMGFFWNRKQAKCLSKLDVTSYKNYPSDKWMCLPISKLDTVLHDKGYEYRMEKMCMELQAFLCREMELIDGKAKFFVDKWDRKDKAEGGGISCVMEDGEVFEKAGINISHINGTLSSDAVKQMKARVTNLDESKSYPFSACGISCVIHPYNPHVPTFHFNFRYFQLQQANGERTWWYGGGADLTPYFLDQEDCRHFHGSFKEACDKHDSSYYGRFKKWCDEYFFLKHRQEARGIGGLFFDDLTASPSSNTTQEEIFAFVRDCADAIGPAYLPIVRKHKRDGFTKDDKYWQHLRRGRYVEFNLVYDRGTKFGLATPEARIESILMSLPKYAQWKYCHDHSGNAKFVELMDVLKNPREWI